MIEQAVSGLNTPVAAKGANKHTKLDQGAANDQGKGEFGKLVADAATKANAKATGETAQKFSGTVQIDPRNLQIASPNEPASKKVTPLAVARNADIFAGMAMTGEMPNSLQEFMALADANASPDAETPTRAVSPNTAEFEGADIADEMPDAMQELTVLAELPDAMQELTVLAEQTDQVAGGAEVPAETVTKQPAGRQHAATPMSLAAQLVAANDTDTKAAPVEDLKAAVKKPADKTDPVAKVAVGQTTATTAEELGLLLGLTRSTETPKASHKAEVKDDDARDAKSEDTVLVGKVALDADGVPIQPVHEKASAIRDQDAGNAKASETSTVRLVSADGKGKPLDITVSKSADDAAPSTDNRGQASKVDTVTVVEARRYLGFSPDSNAGALTTAIKSDPILTEAISRASPLDAIAAPTSTEVNTLKLQMNPDNLGNMVASLRLKGDELTVEVHVETIDAFRQMSADQDSIVKALQDQGFNIDTVTVQLVAAEKTDSNPDRNDQTRQGQNLKDGQGENARERQQDARRSSQQDTWLRNDETNSPGRADSLNDLHRSSDVYL